MPMAEGKQGAVLSGAVIWTDVSFADVAPWTQKMWHTKREAKFKLMIPGGTLPIGRSPPSDYAAAAGTAAGHFAAVVASTTCCRGCYLDFAPQVH